MAETFLGFSETKVCNFGESKFWAENGLIHIESTLDGDYKTTNVHTMLLRMQGISDMLNNSKAELKRSGNMTGQEYERQMKFLEEMVEICNRAKVQGMPSDASAARDLKRRRRVTVTVPGRGSYM